MTQLRRFENDFQRLGVDVKIVTFDDNWMAEAYVKDTNLRWPLLLDTQQQLYRGYGFDRASWWKLIRPSAIFRYVLNIFRGTLPGKPGRDLRQLGGDVLIDPQGVVQLIHASRHPHDRPQPKELIQTIERLSA